MKKLVAIIIIAFLSLSTKAQPTLMDMMNHYFKANPFEQPFNSFLTSIINDHHFIKDEFEKRTDSEFFFLKGYYTDFSPVSITPVKTEIRIAETEFTHPGSHILDTIIVYQLLCTADGTDKGRSQVKKEFKKFNRRYKDIFPFSEYKHTIETDGQPSMELYNYFYIFFQPSPLIVDFGKFTAAWGKNPNGNNYVFTITIRMKLFENEARLVAPPDGF